MQKELPTPDENKEAIASGINKILSELFKLEGDHMSRSIHGLIKVFG